MTKLTFIADTHHYSKTLGTTGRQYFLRAGSDQKCLAETDEIIDAAFKKIAASDTDAVLIAGDVTNNGEMVSHLEFREKLYKLKEKKRVYLITATHDWCCDGNPRRFNGNRVTHDVEVMPSDKLPEFYKDFGPVASISKFVTHIGTCSYVVHLSDNVRLLALNDDKNENNHAGFTEEHFCWIEKQIKQAYEDNCLIIGMEHHLLTPHISPLITGGGTCVADREYVASRLADAGLRYMFVGHSHIQSTTDFKSQKGNVIPVFRFIKTADVEKFYKKLKLFGLAKFVDKKLVKKFKNKKILEFADEMMLSAFDGSIKKYSREDDYYKLVMSVVSIPSKILKNNNDMKKLIFAVDAILTGGKFNNQKDTI